MRKAPFIAIGILLMFSSMLWAAVDPVLNPLTSIRGVGDFEPIRVAAGMEGVVYAADYFNNKVTSFSKEGDQINRLMIKRPVSVAVDVNGHVYVGSVKEKNTYYKGIVTVYDKDLKRLYSLGSGWGEFEYPADIFIYGNFVYVADSKADIVRIFDASTGGSIGVFGGYGRNPGNLVNPMAVSVDPQTGNVYVADRALQFDAANNVWGMGAGVHVFAPDGAFIRSLPIYYGDSVVAGSYSMSSPSGVHVDASGNVFVTDMAGGNMLVFDTLGSFVSDVSLGTVSHYPKGVTQGPDGRLLIAADNQIMVFATSSFVEMAISPDVVNVFSQQCVSTASGSVVTVTNKGGGELQWKAVADSPWIVPTPASGSINGIGSVNIMLDVDSAGLALGTHTGSVTFTSQGDSKTINVTLDSNGAPVLNVAETSLSFDVKGNVIPNPAALNINLTGDASGLMQWTASADSAWLGVSPSSGASDTISIAQAGINQAGLSSLAGGTYGGAITISANCDSVQPVVVPVTLNFIKGGTIKVTANTDGAAYTLSGPATYSGSGSSFVVDVAEAGMYKIVFSPVAGFKSPASYSLEVVEGSTVNFDGQYLDLRENNKIIVSMGSLEAATADALSMFDKDGGILGSFVVSDGQVGAKSASLRAGSSTASGDVDGDGIDEIIVSHDEGIITVYRADGTELAGAGFRAFGFRSDVVLAAADLNGDGRSEIVASPGGDNGDPADVRVFGYDGSAIMDTGIFFSAYQKRLGLNLASGDVNGDGISEILTVRGGSASSGRSIEVRVFGADVSGGAGAWTAKEVATFSGGVSYGSMALASADMDADAIDEIIVASESDRAAGVTSIDIYNVSGDILGSFSVSGSGLYLAAGDVDFDGAAEIVIGDGDASGTFNVRVFDVTGSLKSSFVALDAAGASGVRVSLGQIVGQ